MHLTVSRDFNALKQAIKIQNNENVLDLFYPETTSEENDIGRPCAHPVYATKQSWIRAYDEETLNIYLNKNNLQVTTERLEC